jgi:hypothetical protein
MRLEELNRPDLDRFLEDIGSPSQGARRIRAQQDVQISEFLSKMAKEIITLILPLASRRASGSRWPCALLDAEAAS